MRKAMIFIDGSNVFFDWNRSNAPKLIDIEKYIQIVKDKYNDIEVLRTYYFATETSTNGGFFTSNKQNTILPSNKRQTTRKIL